MNFSRTFQAHEATVFGCCFTPDSLFLVSGSSDGDLNVWDALYGHGKYLQCVPECHDLGVTCCDFSPTFGTNTTGKHAIDITKNMPMQYTENFFQEQKLKISLEKF